MKYSEEIQWLKKYASDCQMAADEMAIKILNQERLFGAISIVQDICDFNLACIYQMSPEVILHIKALEFLSKYTREFNRKITIKELFRFDIILTHNEVNTLDDFKKLLQ